MRRRGTWSICLIATASSKFLFFSKKLDMNKMNERSNEQANFCVVRSCVWCIHFISYLSLLFISFHSLRFYTFSATATAAAAAFVSISTVAPYTPDIEKTDPNILCWCIYKWSPTFFLGFPLSLSRLVHLCWPRQNFLMKTQLGIINSQHVGSKINERKNEWRNLRMITYERKVTPFLHTHNAVVGQCGGAAQWTNVFEITFKQTCIFSEWNNLRKKGKKQSEQ